MMITLLIGAAAICLVVALWRPISEVFRVAREDKAEIARGIERFAPFGYPALIFADGRETYFPISAHAPPGYEIAFSGQLRRAGGGRADAFYRTDADGNFSLAHDWVLVNGSQMSRHHPQFLRSDRCTHRYILRIEANAPQLTIAVKPREGWSGRISTEVHPLPAGSIGPREAARLEATRAAAHREQVARSKRFAAQIKAIALTSEAYRNWADPSYRQRFAELNFESLIRNQMEIRKEALAFFAETQLVRYFERHAPEIVERYRGRLEAVILAERAALEKQSARALGPPPPPRAEPKKRLTTDQVRRIKVARQQVSDDDKVALKLSRIATRLTIRERLSQLPLDGDQREMLEEELIGEIEEGETDGTERTL